MSQRVIAITGIPGAGKTTLANGLVKARGWKVLSTGDIARRIDPAGVSAGVMAVEGAFRAAFAETFATLGQHPVVVLDGIPRSEEQLALLPEGTVIIGLNCRPDIAKDRLLRRERSDDTAEIIDRRIAEQTDLLGINRQDGWLFGAAGWGGVVATSIKSPGQILIDVIGYLEGRKREAF